MSRCVTDFSLERCCKHKSVEDVSLISYYTFARGAMPVSKYTSCTWHEGRCPRTHSSDKVLKKKRLTSEDSNKLSRIDARCECKC